MKNTTSAAMFVKRIISVLRSMARAKSLAIKNKTDAMRARFIVFSLMRNKKPSLGAISDKIHSLLTGAGAGAGGGAEQQRHNSCDSHDISGSSTSDDIIDDRSKAIVPYKTDDDQPLSISSQTLLVRNSMDLELDNSSCYRDKYDDNKYPDLTHSLFDEDEDGLDLLAAGDSVIDLVRNSKEEGQDFSLEDEIDHVADLFIRKFHKNMRMQKLESFKRYQEMLERSA